MKKISMKSQSILNFDDAFDRFIRKCEIKNLTPKSIKSYQQKIRPFKEFLTEHEIQFDEITGDTVDDFIIWVRKAHNANDISINSYLRAVRAFCYFCMDNDYMVHFKVHIPKATKKAKETYSDNELNTLLKKPNKKECTFTEYKTWAFENFLLGTGVRLSTALNIRIKDVDIENGSIFLDKTKNRIQQYIPMAKSLQGIIREYLDIRGGEEDDYLFCNSFGAKADERTYQQMVQNYNRNRGIMRSSCHAFRHTFAKLFIINGGDAFRLQRLMGHSDISVTKEYVELFGSDLSVGFDKFNPLDNLKGNREKMKM